MQMNDMRVAVWRMKEKIILLGCGGHAKSVVDVIEADGRFEIAGFVDNAYQEEFEYHGYKILGCDNDLQKLYELGIRYAYVGVGFLGQGRVRNKLYVHLKKIGYKLPVIADPSAVLAKDVKLGEGVFIGKQAVVNANTEIGKMAIINTAAVIEHDCIIGEFTHVAVASIVCGMVHIGVNSFIGANATIIQGISIGDGSIVGAGSVVVKNIEENMKIKNGTIAIYRGGVIRKGCIYIARAG